MTGASPELDAANSASSGPLPELAKEVDLPPFVSADYSEFITGSGAEKLADSGVAPLVAAARGYKRLDSSNFAPEMRLMGVQGATKQGMRLRRSLNGRGNGMQMPWYSLADIQEADKTGESAIPFTFQVRPDRPENNVHGKPVKYEFIAGSGTPLDAHPTVPASWIDTTPVVMITEGLLKGDSALTAYLHKHGATWAELSDGSEGASERLLQLLRNIPEAERILIVSIAGINNTAQNPADWRHIKLRGREAWIAFDADLDSNIHVWRAAAKLWENLEARENVDRVRLLSPKVTVSSGIEKAGIDDFLAKVGTWDDLLLHMTTGLPEAPVVHAEDIPGSWRISKDGLSTEECVPIKGGPNGEVTAYHWKKVLNFGGRIAVSEQRRQPTDDELRTGEYNDNVRAHEIEDTQTEVEIAWLNADGQVVTATVTGPERVILNEFPREWARKSEVSIPSAVFHLPEWPPTNRDAEKWLKAMKSHRDDEIVKRTRWMQMGWVPVPGGHPVFLIGDQVVGDAAEGAAIGGVDNRELNVASKYGVGEKIPIGDYDDPKYRERVRVDLEAVLDAYVRNKPFTEASTTALILGGALRPVVPLRPKATIFLWGPKGSGKSFGAQRMMAFWARNKNCWIDQLPGSAKDTITYMEHCVARTPIWVTDDMAPSEVKAQAEAENAKLADLTRNIFNNAAKGRMNANMTSRASNMPIAQFVITAEHTLTTPSVKERLIPAFLGPGKLNESRDPTDELERIAFEDGTPARLTAHLIKYVIYTSSRMDGGWAAYIEEMQDRVRSIQNKVQVMMRERGTPPGSLKRVSSLAADIILSISLLHKLAITVGADAKTISMLTDKGLVKDLVNGVHNAHMDNQQYTPGRSTLRAVAALLNSGRAHVINAAVPSIPPVTDDLTDNTLVNMSLGWVNNTGSEGGLKAGGICIGRVVNSPKFGQLILFFPDVAFNAAQDAHSEMIQHGQQQTGAWNSVWDEGLTPEGLTRTTPKGKAPLNTWRFQGISGVPVAVKDLLKQGDETSDYLEDDQN
ncbi:hypothetical protein ACX3O0_01320 [Homoserinimonas sp. A447]